MKANFLMSFSALALMSQAAFAQNQVQRYQEAYKSHERLAQVICAAPGVKTISTKVNPGVDFVSTLKLNDKKFKIRIYTDDQFVHSQLIYGNKIVKGTMYRNKNLGFEEAYASDLKLSNLGCAIKNFYDKPLEINSSQVHISVHAHQSYDRYGYTTNLVNRYLSDSSHQNFALFDQRDNRFSMNVFQFINDMPTAIANINRGKYAKPIVYIPKDVEMSIAPAGHSLFNFNNDNVEITYTGGNINYCISNNSRSAIRDFIIQNPNGGKLTLNYDLDAIVAQRTTLGFSKLRNPYGFKVKLNGKKQYNSIVAKDYFNSKPKFAKKYHKFINKDIIEEIQELYNGIDKTTLFKTVTFKYEYKGEVERTTIQGTGRGNFDITIQHINE